MMRIVQHQVSVENAMMMQLQYRKSRMIEVPSISGEACSSFSLLLIVALCDLPWHQKSSTQNMGYPPIESEI